MPEGDLALRHRHRRFAKRGNGLLDRATDHESVGKPAEEIRRAPYDVTVVATGPLTNIATAAAKAGTPFEFQLPRRSAGRPFCCIDTLIQWG